MNILIYLVLNPCGTMPSVNFSLNNIAISTITITFSVTCNNNYNLTTGIPDMKACYKMSSDGMNQSEAISFCEKNGGRIAALSDYYEKSLVSREQINLYRNFSLH